jgi:hypothetical protein
MIRPLMVPLWFSMYGIAIMPIPADHVSVAAKTPDQNTNTNTNTNTRLI